jgi:hypothetical protein
MLFKIAVCAAGLATASALNQPAPMSRRAVLGRAVATAAPFAAVLQASAGDRYTAVGTGPNGESAKPITSNMNNAMLGKGGNYQPAVATSGVIQADNSVVGNNVGSGVGAPTAKTYDAGAASRSLSESGVGGKVSFLSPDWSMIFTPIRFTIYRTTHSTRNALPLLFPTAAK